MSYRATNYMSNPLTRAALSGAVGSLLGATRAPKGRLLPYMLGGAGSGAALGALMATGKNLGAIAGDSLVDATKMNPDGYGAMAAQLGLPLTGIAGGAYLGLKAHKRIGEELEVGDELAEEQRRKHKKEKTAMAFYEFGAKLGAREEKKAQSACSPCAMPNSPTNKKHTTSASPAVLAADQKSEEIGKPPVTQTEHSAAKAKLPEEGAKSAQVKQANPFAAFGRQLVSRMLPAATRAAAPAAAAAARPAATAAVGAAKPAVAAVARPALPAAAGAARPAATAAASSAARPASSAVTPADLANRFGSGRSIAPPPPPPARPVADLSVPNAVVPPRPAPVGVSRAGRPAPNPLDTKRPLEYDVLPDPGVAVNAAGKPLSTRPATVADRISRAQSGQPITNVVPPKPGSSLSPQAVAQRAKAVAAQTGNPVTANGRVIAGGRAPSGLSALEPAANRASLERAARNPVPLPSGHIEHMTPEQIQWHVPATRPSNWQIPGATPPVKGASAREFGTKVAIEFPSPSAWAGRAEPPELADPRSGLISQNGTPTVNYAMKLPAKTTKEERWPGVSPALENTTKALEYADYPRKLIGGGIGSALGSMYSPLFGWGASNSPAARAAVQNLGPAPAKPVANKPPAAKTTSGFAPTAPSQSSLSRGEDPFGDKAPPAAPAAKPGPTLLRRESKLPTSYNDAAKDMDSGLFTGTTIPGAAPVTQTRFVGKPGMFDSLLANMRNNPGRWAAGGLGAAGLLALLHHLNSRPKKKKNEDDE